jgi:hypothetical protein
LTPVVGTEGGGREPEDVALSQLKGGWRRGEQSARRTLWTVLSGLLVASAGVLLIVGAFLPWVSIGGVSISAVREGGPDGAAATFACVVGGALIVLGVVSAVGRRGAPRFLHWLALLLTPIVFILVRYRSDILGNLIFVHNTDQRQEGLAVAGSGINVVYAGFALSLAAPFCRCARRFGCCGPEAAWTGILCGTRDLNSESR